MRKKLKLKAVVKFDKKFAKRAMNMLYYKAQSKNMKDYPYIEKEKFRLSTKKWERISKILEDYKERGYNGEKSLTGKILKGIYEKNKKMALSHAPFQKTTNLVPIVANIETLLLAYKRIKKNKGAMTRASNVDRITLLNYDEKQREIYYKKKIFPDGFSLRDLEIASFLILKGRYPWGSSRRIWLDKPGYPNKKRPITIPPFLDRVVQEAIKTVLYSIWEPDFERLNRSFGFRPNKSCHDAIYGLKSNTASGLHIAVEGDIQGAYDNVDKKILLNQLRRKIEDKAFLNLMWKRLQYDYVDDDNNVRIKPKFGIPQGGIDSPYLFNIYLHDLALFVHEEIKRFVESLNKKVGVPADRAEHRFKPKRAIKALVDKKRLELKKIKATFKQEVCDVSLNRKKLFKLIYEIRLLNHKSRKMEYTDPQRRRLRIFYVRYADDWILLCNGNISIARNIKEKIKNFLRDNLKATLSEEKTTITNICDSPARFLGFEISRPSRGRLIRVKRVLKHTYGPNVIQTDLSIDYT
jgi:hypothetical protein